jgi:hypothetical protein
MYALDNDVNRCPGQFIGTINKAGSNALEPSA